MSDLEYNASMVELARPRKGANLKRRPTPVNNSGLKPGLANQIKMGSRMGPIIKILLLGLFQKSAIDSSTG
jgi:hypothetical protein